MIRKIILILCAIVSLLTGCAARSQQTKETALPTSYKFYKSAVSRLVGRLRRLVIMPACITMERVVRKISLLLIAFLVSACASTETWQTSSVPTPLSYERQSGTLKRCTGILRRLLIVPVQFKTLKGDKLYVDGEGLLNDYGFPPDEEVSRELTEEAVKYLSHWKGYEVVNLDTNSPSPNESALAKHEIDRYFMELRAWSKKPANYEVHSDQIVNIVSELGRPCKADGVLVISGTRKLPSDAKVTSVILSAGLLWPILLIDTGDTFEGSVYEVRSGRIVWSVRDAPSMRAVLEELDTAVPEVLTR